MTTIALRHPRVPLPLIVGIAVVGWLIAWFAAAPFAAWFAFDVLGLQHGGHLGEAVAFFAFDVPKVLLLLLGIVTVVTLIRGFFPPEKVRGALAGRGEFAGTVAAASFGIVTPFCSCSAVPLFIGFVEAGDPARASPSRSSSARRWSTRSRSSSCGASSDPGSPSSTWRPG